MKVYRFRISIMGLPKVYRIIEASENCTFDDLHEVIFEAFHRYDPHLYSFFMTKKDSKNIREIWDSPEITHPQSVESVFGFGKKRKSGVTTKIGTAGFTEGDIFHYLFDYGDEWWHRIRVQSVTGADRKKKFLKITKSIGQSPPQYPDYEEEEEDFDEDD
mgnify:CR=1 FL=1